MEIIGVLILFKCQQGQWATALLVTVLERKETDGRQLRQVSGDLQCAIKVSAGNISSIASWLRPELNNMQKNLFCNYFDRYYDITQNFDGNDNRINCENSDLDGLTGTVVTTTQEGFNKVINFQTV